MRIRKPIATALTVAMLVVCMVGVAEAKKKRRLPTLAIGGRTIAGPITRTIPASGLPLSVWRTGGAMVDVCATVINLGREEIGFGLFGRGYQAVQPLASSTLCQAMTPGLHFWCRNSTDCLVLYRIDAIH